MTVIGGAQHGSWQRRRFGHDRRGTLQVVEVMVVGVLVVSAIIAVSTLQVPTTETEGFKRDNELLVKDSLNALLLHPSDYGEGNVFGNELEEFIMEALAGNPSPLTSFLNKSLPGGAVYNVYLENGHGPPFPVVSHGAPPREAVAGSIQFVPKLAYTFVIPEFAHYEGDFPMKMFGVPIQNGLLSHDEGDTVEFAVTFREMDSLGNPVGDPLTIRTYGHTALRYNDPDVRQWPGVSMWLNDSGTRSHYLDASQGVVYENRIDNLIGGGQLPTSGDAYNITFEMAFEELAGVKVPKNAEITIEFPRGWDFNASRQAWLANSDEVGNVDYWKDWSFEGESLRGWIVKAKLRDGFANERVPLVISSNYRMVFDTAYPYFNAIDFNMGGGAQGKATIVVKPPSSELFGSLRRDPHISIPKPIIAGEHSYWGAAFTNMGNASIQIINVSVSQPQGVPLFGAMTHESGWAPGEWSRLDDSGYWWEADVPLVPVPVGESIHFTMDVTAAGSTYNHYRNHNYHDVRFYFAPYNTTDGYTLPDYNYTKRATTMAEEWVYTAMVPPQDGDITGATPGWPDEAAKTYWVRAGTYVLQRELIGNTTYESTPAGFASNHFGSYQGGHVYSTLNLVDKQGEPAREFELGEKVRIQNDFSALFGELSALNGVGGVTVSDLIIRSSIYTPEKGWKNIATQVIEESASVTTSLGTVVFLDAADVNDDGVEDIIVAGSGGIVYALDGTDGAKFWTYIAGASVSTAILADYDGDDVPELYLGVAGAQLQVIDTRPGVAAADRLIFTHDLDADLPVLADPYAITSLLDVSSVDGIAPELVAAVSPQAGDSTIVGLDVDIAGEAMTVAPADLYQTNDILSNPSTWITDLALVDAGLGPSVAASSVNGTVTLLSLPGLATIRWITELPFGANTLHALDTDGDGDEDIVADTLDPSAVGGEATHVFTISGDTGNWGPILRELGTTGLPTDVPRDGGVTPSGITVIVGGGEYIIQDTTTLYGVRLSQAVIGGGDVFDLSNVAPHDWMGAQLTSTNEVYIIDIEGTVLFGDASQLVADGLYWSVVKDAQALDGREFLDLHLDPDWESTGSGYLFTNDGIVVESVDEFANEIEIASICGEVLPASGLDCGNDPEVREWTMTGANDFAETAHALVQIKDGVDKGAHVVTFDFATDTWTVEQSWTNVQVEDMQVLDDGTTWVVGYDTDADMPFIAAAGAPAPAVSDHFLGATSATELDTILIQDDGTRFVAAKDGHVWKETVSQEWVPWYVAGANADFHGTFLHEDHDGKVWLWTDDYRHTPLATYAPEGQLLFGEFADFLTNQPVGTTTLNVEVTVGVLGGSTGDGLSPLTDVQFFARENPNLPWRDFIPNEINLEPDPNVYTTTYTVPLTCDPMITCVDMQVKADMRHLVIKEGAEGMRRDAGLSPLVRDMKLTWGVGPVTHTMTAADLDPDDNEAEWSDFHGGFTLPVDNEHWSYYGVANAGLPGVDVGKRLTAVSEKGLADGTGAGDLVVAEYTNDLVRALILDGRDGHRLHPAAGAALPLAGDDRPDALLVGDAAGDGIEDVLMAGRMGGVDGAVRIWDPRSTETLDTDGDSSTSIYGFATSGVDQGRLTFAWAGSAEQVTSWRGALPGGEPKARWSLDPNTVQGAATFEYKIPMTALYGTGIVVSELSFEIDDGVGTATQTARLVDWFQITPPDRPVPRPPVYTIEIVSWFNEV